jgi:hypothetical protein
MSDCPLHASGQCPLQKLAIHTVIVTEARARNVCAIVLILDRDDASHVALAADIEVPDVLQVLTRQADELRRRMQEISL